MNERLQELAEQATTTDCKVDNGFCRATFDKEKFAKLIIEECGKVIYDGTNASIFYRYRILRHFGFEE